MGTFLSIFGKLSKWLNGVAAIILFLMMMLTVTDVILRAFGRPLVGVYELVAIGGALVIGLATAQTCWDKGHVLVDFLLENRSQGVKNAFWIGTRIVGIILFGLLSFYLTLKGNHLYKSGEVSLTLHIPYYPAAYVLSLCFFVVCFVYVADIFKLYVRENGHE